MNESQLPKVNIQGLERKSKMLLSISPSEQEGLEIGPLCWPIVTKRESNGKIYYVDYSKAEYLREKYKNNKAVNINEIVETDYLWGEKTLPEIVDGRLFDYVIASHVIEHVPNMLGWLQEISEVLKDDGTLSLAIPDKRYTFDIKRELTSMGELIEAYLLNRRRPTPKSIFDHKSLSCKVDMVLAWNGGIQLDKLEHSGSLKAAHLSAQQYLATDQYQDVHVNILTPSRFLDLIEASCQLGLFNYVFSAFHDTFYNSHEFLVSLKRIPRHLSKEQILELQLSNISQIREKIETSGVNIVVADSASDQLQQLNVKNIKIAVSMMNIGSSNAQDLTVIADTNLPTLIDMTLKETNPLTGEIIGNNTFASINVGESRTMLLVVTLKEFKGRNLNIHLKVCNSSGEVVGYKEIKLNF
ncbi:MAG TPA: hypothetical protein DDY18_11215 [Flavobacterium sp.]|nr:hypothetical protein [Flavobacterium sp.]